MLPGRAVATSSFQEKGDQPRKAVALRSCYSLGRQGACRLATVREEAVAYRDLREFVRRLEKEGELKRIGAEVDPVLEITEVVQRVARDKQRQPNSLGPALLFEKPKGSRSQLLINTFGSVRRMALALDVDKLDEVAERIQGFLKMESPEGLFDK